jgi:riboflavin kinase/FMN adenylyltransferase
MQVIREPEPCPRPDRGSVVTIGAYDGVHVGHRVVIDTCHRLAAERGLATAVVTFDRHPATVVRPESAPLVLTDLDQKLELLAETGVDYTAVLTFDEARSKEGAEDFVTDVLVGCLNAKAVVVGADFHFGHRRRGNVELLRRMGADLGFDVVGLDLVGTGADGADGSRDGNDGPVSSTAIRRALADGDLDRANRMLGRPYEIRGTVVQGDLRGRTWDFPTANVDVPSSIQLPADGIYASWYERPTGEIHPSAVSLGRRPTIYDDQTTSPTGSSRPTSSSSPAICTANRRGCGSSAGCGASSSSTRSTNSSTRSGAIARRRLASSPTSPAGHVTGAPAPARDVPRPRGRQDERRRGRPRRP